MKNRQLNRDIISDNEVEKNFRKSEYNQELNQDKAMIQALLDKEEATKIREYQAVQALREEAKAMQGFTSMRA